MATTLTQVQEDFIGLIFRATVKDENGDAIDLSGASTKELHFEAPSGAGKEMTAAFYTDGTDGVIQYTTVSGDLDEDGTWSVQAYVVDAGLGINGHSTKHQFEVVANLAVEVP